jgi:hypothetical protein
MHVAINSTALRGKRGGTAGMNTEEAARVRHSHGRADEREERLMLDRDPLRRSVEILRDLGLSKEKIVAYHRRFPTPTPTSCRYRPPASTLETA